MSEILAKLETAPRSHRAIILADTLQSDTEQRILLARYIQQHMKEGTDFGTIPGTPKPTLYKPGAEKLVDLFRCTPKYKLMRCDEDFERGFFSYMFRAQLVSRDAGVILAEGYGSCNSREGRYRWREAQRKCPTCGKPTIFQSKQEPGWFCWAKKGGCNAKFSADAPAITTQLAGKIENDDIATMANTILKMAKKRALVDGAIALARCSDMFTQDVEDFAEAAIGPEHSGPTRPTNSGKSSTLKVKLQAKFHPESVSEEPPPPSDTDAPPEVVDAEPTEQAAPPSASGVVVPFGKKKGTPIESGDVTARDLAFLIEYAQRAINDPAKERYRLANSSLLSAVRTEQQRRGL